MSERNFEGVYLSSELWLTKELNVTEKVILVEIKSFDKDFGCVATNKKIGDNLGLKPNSISLIIKSLLEKGFIKVTYRDYNTFEGRVIEIDYDKCIYFFTPPKKSKGVTEKSKAPTEKSIHSNTISNNNSNIKDNDELKNSSSAYQLFNHYWLKEFHIDWTFTGVQGKAVKSLINKTRKVLKDAGRDFCDEEVLNFMRAMCQNLPEWYKQKDLMVLDSKFNEIISEIKSAKNGRSVNTKGQSIFRPQR